MGLLNYDSVARTYQKGRGPLADIEECRRAVQPHLPPHPRVLDLGAGTGIFARVWPEWGAREVVVVEPSAGMLAEARRVGLPTQVRAVRGQGEAIPLARGSLDAVWMSAMYHHLSDPERCIADLHRVVAPGGVVFLRALYADLEIPGWCNWFPGGDKAAQRFTNLADLTRSFEAAGFRFRAAEPCRQRTRPPGEIVEWVRLVRDADTFLGGLSPEAVDAGIAALEATDLEEIDCGFLHVAVYERL